MDRDMAGLGIMLEQVEQDEAVDVRQAEVERDRRRLQLARHGEGAGPGDRYDALQIGLMRGIEQDRCEGRIILDDQHKRAFAEVVAVVVDLKARRKRGGDDGAAIVVARRRARNARRRPRRRLPTAHTGVKVEPSPGFERT